MKTWSDVSATNEYKGADQATKDTIRSQYFDQVIAPKIPEEHRSLAQKQFMTDTEVRSDTPKPNVLSPFGDTAASLISGSVAPVVAGFAGIAGAALPGPEGQGADWVKKTEEALTYEPRTSAGKAITAAVAYPGEKLAQGADYVGGKVTDVTGSPALGAAANTAIQALPLAVSKVASKIAPGGETYKSFAARRAEEVTNLQKDAAVVKAKEAGYVLPPSQVSDGAINKAVEGFGGKIKTAQTLSEKNQPITNRLIREEFGLPSDAPLNTETLAAVRKQAGQAYDRIRGTGQVTADEQFVTDLTKLSAPYERVARDFPNSKPSPIIDEVANTLEPTFDAGSAVDKIRMVREQADAAFGAKDKALGKAYRGIAQALEDQLDRHLLTVRGIPPNVLMDFQDARRTIAKTYTVEKALRETTGNVDAKKLATRLGKDPLTGNIRTVAEFGQSFPKVAQVPERIGGIPIGPLDYGVALLKGGVAGLIPFTRPFARNVLSSKAYQNAMVGPPSYGPSLGNRLLGLQENPLSPITETTQGQRQ